MSSPDAAWFARPAPELARRLLGCELAIGGVAGVIVECEAYTRDDPASHSFRGPTARNAAMFGPSGCAYVYRAYGIHWMFNLVAEDGGAVLVRALEPTRGIDEMRRRRGVDEVAKLCSGPGKLAQALALDRGLDGRAESDGFSLRRVRRVPRATESRRIGITKAVDVPWRFSEAGSRFVSRPWPAARPSVPDADRA